MMRRRDFLRATLVTAGSVVVPAACTDDVKPAGACAVHEDDAFFPQSVASGDPRHDSVVLWTRLVDGEQQADLNLALVVALDEAFTQLVALEPSSDTVATVGSSSTQFRVTARAEFDHCVKVKVTGLSPGTTYYYRFYYTTGEGCVSSRVGRTQTAPARDADVPVRFAFVSGQDYIGRYYNAYAALAKEQLDFVVHLGGYIYETTGDPSLQAPSEQRSISFSDVNGAIAFQPAEGAAYHAAKSLSNYRELYKTYRSDRALQRVHELFPMIAVWGDHEFSNDCHGATAAYLDGREPETDEYRRKAANQAWFEYMPVDYPNDPAGDDFRYDSAVAYPADITIYRDFPFGQHVHLVMTDLRSYRADHLIPEDAFPGKVVAQKADLDLAFEGAAAERAALAPYMSLYIADIDGIGWSKYKDALEKAAPLFGFDPHLGFAQNETPRPLSAAVVNQIVAKLNEQSADQVPLISAGDMASLDLGIAYADLGKTDYYSALGSRYFVVKDTFDPVSTIALTADAARGVVMGEAQRAWFEKTMSESQSTWKVWGNEYRLSQLAVAITEDAEPEPLTRHIYLSCDGWDGFRKERNELLEVLASVPGNVVSITGDLGAFLAGTPAVDNTASTAKIVEFGGSAISSATYSSVLAKQVASHPALKGALSEKTIDGLLVDSTTKVNPHLAFSNASSNGFCVVEANADELVVSMHMIPEDALAAPLYEETDAAALEGQITIARYKTKAGEPELYWDDAGSWKKWNPDTATWDVDA
ncbi:alkaline phosphatase D family protein [Sorangium sp. So ce375]|uniref:alkaline phosphatase D family protein n=1 Tax=Sorangium sp. So ce375 TaxID=3133306 RepID=UPI003F5C6772